jgi:hypothetical protein
MEFYSATEMNEILLFAGKWMEVNNITLSEGHKLHVFSHIWNTDTAIL